MPNFHSVQIDLQLNSKDIRLMRKVVSFQKRKHSLIILKNSRSICWVKTKDLHSITVMTSDSSTAKLTWLILMTPSHFNATLDVVAMFCVNILRWYQEFTLVLIRVIYLWQCKVCSAKTTSAIGIKFGLPKLSVPNTLVTHSHSKPIRWSASWETHMMFLCPMLMRSTRQVTA